VLPPPVQAFFDALGRRDAQRLAEALAPGCVWHANGRRSAGAGELLAAFPGGAFTVLDGVREADRVAVRWAVAGDGGTRAEGLTLFRLAGGRVAELWSHASPLA
jgi:ketosteroid isomerase-like protein